MGAPSPMTTTLLPQKIHQVLLENISWQTYQALLKDIEEQPGIRMTYDHGTLEIMAPLRPHESAKKLIGRFIEALTEELGIEICSLGSLTCKREDLARGLEPDQCYYIQHESAIRELDDIDLTRDPPPDLAVEIDITYSSVNRLAIYEALGVPEVWRYDGKKLTIYYLENQKYEMRNDSPAFPKILVTELVRFLELRKTMGETSLIRSFREWVRNQIK
jgi:Uma2 family endonuclease